MNGSNVKIGVKSPTDTIKYVGPIGIGSRNEKGKRLLNFAEKMIK